MPCYTPLSAFRTPAGVEFHDTGRGEPIQLPCGRCIGCRLERSRMWATRIMFESQFHPSNSFITLTYNDKHLPDPPSLDYTHFQLFMKRLRKHFGPLRFYMCGEYGDLNRRPHYHACIFGTDFPDRIFHSVLSSGYNVYRSQALESLWPYGFSSVCDLSFDSAAYVARYCLKKITGDLAEEHYKYVHPETGEVSQLTPEFAHMSLKPGIGSQWFDKYKKHSSHDYVVINGRRCKPPRYYDKLLKRADPARLEEFKETRQFDAYPRRLDNLPHRLAVKQEVQLAALRQLPSRGVPHE